MSNLSQCTLCQRWNSTQQSLLVHLNYCRQRHECEQDNNGNPMFLVHNPLQSCRNVDEHINPFNVYCESDSSDQEGNDNDNNHQLNYSADYNSTDGEEFVTNEITDNDPFLSNDNENITSKSFTAISKLQKRMNDLINHHKAPIKLYDDMVN